MRILGIVAFLSAALSFLPVQTVLAQAKPTPTPAPLTVAAVAADRRIWPKEVITKAPASRVVRKAGQADRTFTLPAGQMAALVNVDRETVLVVYQGTEFTLPAASTDLLAGASALRLQLASQGGRVSVFDLPPPADPKAEQESMMRRILAREGGWLIGLLGAIVVLAFVVRRAFREE